MKYFVVILFLIGIISSAYALEFTSLVATNTDGIKIHQGFVGKPLIFQLNVTNHESESFDFELQFTTRLPDDTIIDKKTIPVHLDSNETKTLSYQFVPTKEGNFNTSIFTESFPITGLVTFSVLDESKNYYKETIVIHNDPEQQNCIIVCTNPSETSINVGSVVEWINTFPNYQTIQTGIYKEDVKGISFSADNRFVGVIPPEGKFSFLFLEPDDYKYYFSEHRFLQFAGIIHVLPSGQLPPQDYEEKIIPSPLKQMKLGIKLGHIICDEDRNPTWNIHFKPACVFPNSEMKLLERGWSKLRLMLPASSDPIKELEWTGQNEVTYRILGNIRVGDKPPPSTLDEKRKIVWEYAQKYRLGERFLEYSIPTSGMYHYNVGDKIQFDLLEWGSYSECWDLKLRIIDIHDQPVYEDNSVRFCLEPLTDGQPGWFSSYSMGKEFGEFVCNKAGYYRIEVSNGEIFPPMILKNFACLATEPEPSTVIEISFGKPMTRNFLPVVFSEITTNAESLDEITVWKFELIGHSGDDRRITWDTVPKDTGIFYEITDDIGQDIIDHARMPENWAIPSDQPVYNMDCGGFQEVTGESARPSSFPIKNNTNTINAKNSWMGIYPNSDGEYSFEFASIFETLVKLPEGAEILSQESKNCKLTQNIEADSEGKYTDGYYTKMVFRLE